MLCRNCGSVLTGPYCHQCGQSSKTERLSAAFLWNEFFHFFTHIEKGFLFTSWRMLCYPAKTIRDFIEGRRKKYQGPISYFLVWTALLILFLYGIQHLFGIDRVIDYNNYFGQGYSTTYAVAHLNIILTAIIPFLALYFYFFIAPKDYNYIESAVAIIYYLGTIILLQFVFALLVLTIHFITGTTIDLHVSDIFKIAYLLWFTINCGKIYDSTHRLIKGVCFALLTFGTFSLWRLYLYPLVAEYFTK